MQNMYYTRHMYGLYGTSAVAPRAARSSQTLQVTLTVPRKEICGFKKTELIRALQIQVPEVVPNN